MKRFGPRAAFAAIAKQLSSGSGRVLPQERLALRARLPHPSPSQTPRGRIYALAPAVALLGLALGSAAIAPGTEPGQPVDLGAAARAMLDRGRPLITELPRPEPDARLGSFKLTYYYMAEQEGGRRSVALYNKKGCKRIARVSRKDAKQLALQGGGKLDDGRVLIYAGRCSCSRAACYTLARDSHEWGTGVEDRPLSPFRSVAVDPHRVAIGTVLYVPELDGLTVPGRMPEGGSVHDGCVVADDRGGGIKGRQLDLFTAKKVHYNAFTRRNRIKRVNVFRGGERCKSLGKRVTARLGDG
jgi:3D (Asp-Asp-Asp) domain-containing protein